MGCSSSQTIIIQEAAPAKSQAEQLDPVPEVVQAQIAVVPEVHAERSEADIPEALPGLVEAEKISVKSGDQNISNDYDGPEGVEWTKVGSSMTWAASEDYASIRKGRLLTLEEARQFLKKRGDFALYPGEDQWVACVRADGVRDWVQVGNKIHHLGKSHVDECGGYPRWGDDSSGKPPFACSVMWLSSGVVPSPKPQWKKHGTSFTWGSSKEHASKAGGRLLDLKEARSFLADHGPLWPGEDQWVAVTRSDGTAWRDWLQVGNKIHHLGKSHVDECGGYPHWGDDSSGNPPHARSVLWIEDLDPENTKKGPIWQKQSCSLTWEASKQNAARLGGRLLLLEEAEDFLKKSGALCPGGDQWAAVVASDGSRDWIQVGDKIHRVGKSHVKGCGGYPRWGDDAAGNPPHARSLLWIAAGWVLGDSKWVKQSSALWRKETGEVCEPMWLKPGPSLTWEDSQQFAAQRCGQLLTLQEATSFLASHGPLFVGDDQWAAVVREDGTRDWVQVGNKHHHVGKSHVDGCGSYPSWGDDASKNPPHAHSVLWLATSNAFSSTNNVGKANED